jgi:phosphoribosylformimino-5-aminoimidazole carboxamide ribotide isomerase
LAQGDPDRETSYSDDPLQVARRWAAAGATALHVVNLDGAFGEGGNQNQRALARMLDTSLAIQTGGGIRDLTSLSAVLEMGVSRVVVGTAFVEDPAFVREALVQFGPERVAVGIDAREGLVRIRGWQEAAPITSLDLAQRWADMGGRWLVFTDISRDGMGSGVNVDATVALMDATSLNVIASGGVRTLADVQRVRDARLAGVIIGRALYEGHLELADALALASAQDRLGTSGCEEATC